jgi:hypothetical protein
VTLRRIPASVLLALGLAALMLAAAVAIRTSANEHAAPSASDSGDPRAIALRPTWGFRPDTLRALTGRAPAAVVAEVTAVEAGPELSDGSKLHPDAGMPTERVQFQLVDAVYGDVPATFDLFRLGAPDVAVDGDPAYEPGERYVLFLEPRVNGSGQREAGTFVPVAPDGRLQVVAGKVEPVIEGPVGRANRGRDVQAFKNDARDAREGG